MVRILGRGIVKHYRVNKLTAPDGEIIKKKDILAATDREAVQVARADDDCPICDVWRAGQKVGAVS